MSDVHEPRLRREFGSAGGGWRLNYDTTRVWVDFSWKSAPSPRRVRRAARKAKAKHAATHAHQLRVDAALMRAKADMSSEPETLLQRLHRVTHIGEERP